MKTTCTRCGARYALPDDKAKPGARIRCRKCGTAFPLVPTSPTDRGPLQRAASTAVARSGPRTPNASANSEGSAMFSLAALARSAVDRPTADPTRDDSDLIDLKQVRSEARDATVTPVPTAIPLLPLGVNPLGIPTVNAPSAALPARDRGMPPWVLVVGSVIVAVVIVGVAFVSRSGSAPEIVPAAPPSAIELPGPEPEPVGSASAAPPAPSVSAKTAPSSESPPVDTAPIGPRPPRPPRPPVVERQPPPPPPPTKPANPCAHCGTDLSCSMACRVNGG